MLPFLISAHTHTHHLDRRLLLFIKPLRIFIIFVWIILIKMAWWKTGYFSNKIRDHTTFFFNSWFCGLSTAVRSWSITSHNGHTNERNIKWTQRNSPLLPTEIQFPDPQEARRPRWPALHTRILCAHTICSLPSAIIILAIYSTGRDVPWMLWPE
jgi:hypothetical protein